MDRFISEHNLALGLDRRGFPSPPEVYSFISENKPEPTFEIPWFPSPPEVGRFISLHTRIHLCQLLKVSVPLRGR